MIMSNFNQEIVGQEWDNGHVADTRNAIMALIVACDKMTKNSLRYQNLRLGIGLVK